MLNSRHVRFFRAKVQEKLKHSSEGRSVLVPAANVPDPVNIIREYVIQLVYSVHGIKQGAFSKWKCNHPGIFASFQKHGELQIRTLAVQVEIQMCEKPFIGCRS